MVDHVGVSEFNMSVMTALRLKGVNALVAEHTEPSRWPQRTQRRNEWGLCALRDRRDQTSGVDDLERLILAARAGFKPCSTARDAASRRGKDCLNGRSGTPLADGQERRK
jgi:hypothetical protein